MNARQLDAESRQHVSQPVAQLDKLRSHMVLSRLMSPSHAHFCPSLAVPPRSPLLSGTYPACCDGGVRDRRLTVGHESSHEPRTGQTEAGFVRFHTRVQERTCRSIRRRTSDKKALQGRPHRHSRLWQPGPRACAEPEGQRLRRRRRRAQERRQLGQGEEGRPGSRRAHRCGEGADAGRVPDAGPDAERPVQGSDRQHRARARRCCSRTASTSTSSRSSRARISTSC